MSDRFFFHYEDTPVASATGETVLDSLVRSGVEVPSSCRAGACQSCLVRAREGSVPAQARKGLRSGQIQAGEFLACQCPAAPDLVLERAGRRPEVPALVAEVEPLRGDVLRVWVEPLEPLGWKAGQFIHLIRPDGLFRAYSISNTPESGRMELHVARLTGGAMSGWLACAVGEKVTLRGPLGECVYAPPSPETPLLLAGTGTGLSPLLGVLRDAMAQGHQGPIELLWGSPVSSRLYLLDELLELASSVPQLSVVVSALDNDAELAGLTETPLPDLFCTPDRPWRDLEVFLCGNAELVRTLKKKAYLAGATLARIHSDPFEAAQD